MQTKCYCSKSCCSPVWIWLTKKLFLVNDWNVLKMSYEYKHIYIIIKLRYQHGYFRPSLATPPYRSLLLVGLPFYIQHLHRAAVCMFELDVLPLFCEGVHRSTSLTSTSLLLQQCPLSLARLILIVFVTGGRLPYSCCFVGCCLQDLPNITRSILV